MNQKQQLQAWVPTWEEVRDQEVQKVVHEAGIELRHLVEIQKLTEARRVVVAHQLEEFGESEARVRAHQTQARWWFSMAGFAVLVTVVSLWLGVGWFVSSLLEQIALTASVFVLSIIGGGVLLRTLNEHLREDQLRRVFAGLGTITILCAITAAMMLGIGRMTARNFVEAQQQQLSQQNDDLGSSSTAHSTLAMRAQAVARRLELLANLWGILLAVAGDLGTLIAVHQWMRHRTVVRTVEPVLREYQALGEELAANAQRQEEMKRWPELRYIELTLAGYRHEQDRAAALHAERARQEAERAREAKRSSLGRTIKWTVIWFAVGIIILGLAVVWASAAPADPHGSTLVVVLDLSTSEGTNAEFGGNIHAVETLIRRLPAGQARLVVLGVTEASFAAPTLLNATSPGTPGRFGEYLGSWQERSIRQWRIVARTLAPTANGSDLFGAMARSAVELAEASGPKSLIVLSDMRQVGRGFNFEQRPTGDPVRVVDQIQRAKMIPKLDGVEVWMLGVHTTDIDEGHWNQLRAIWTEYLRRTGATLKAYSPNRRWGGE